MVEETGPAVVDGRGNGRILIADDEPGNVALLRRVLREAGHTDVCTITDPTGLAPVMAEFGPDLLLLDWHMPQRHGAQVLADLRDDPRWSRLPVIVVTADPAARLESLALGATDFLTKPFDPPEIVLRVRNVLRVRRLHRELQAQNDELERRVLERTLQLRASNEKLRQTEVVQRDFVAMASHEMRTPLTVIRGFLEHWTSRGIPAPGTVEAQLDAIRRNVGRLEHLVHNLLLASRVESGSDGHRRRTFEFRELLAPTGPVGDSSQPVTVTSDVSGRYAGDPELLELVLANLLSNAQRYGRPPIEVRAEVVDGGVEIRVVDHGPGVPEEFVPRLFERFTQATSGDRRTSQGAGLGLWVSQHIVAIHGGDLWYEPTPGGGATFVTRLPGPARPDATDASAG